MFSINSKRYLLWIALAGVVACIGCSNSNRSSEGSASRIAAASPIPADTKASERVIRFLEDRVKRDPDDFIALNKLATQYLQRQRETGSVDYIDLSLRAARGSMAAMPDYLNKGGLAALAQAEFAAHEFSAARDHAVRLTEIDSQKSYAYQILADALIELGDYDGAARAIENMTRSGAASTSLESRLGRYSLLHGDAQGASQHFSRALSLALSEESAKAESVAWLRWQMGETAFSTGDYQSAEKSYRDALVTLPNYYRALASMGRVRAAQSDLQGAIESYERAVSIVPDPSFVGALGDLYQLAGRNEDAAAQFALVDQIERLGKARGSIYNRLIALFHADHDSKLEDAYQSAAAEYSARRDVYGADAVAWTALKSGRLTEAQSSIREALRLGTRDAKLFYHAGMIALASGDTASARDFLQRALTLNPHFDPIQATNARKALERCAPGA